MKKQVLFSSLALLLTSFLSLTPEAKEPKIIITRLSEGLCTDCSVSIRQWIQANIPISKQADPSSKKPRVWILFPELDWFQAAGQYILETRLLPVLENSITGKLILKHVKSLGQPVDFRLFYQIAESTLFGQSPEPLWVKESRAPHDLYGFFHSDGSRAIVALNNYQPFQAGAYSLVHELFHLIDGYQIETGSELLKQVVFEYRALLAEVMMYQEYRLRGELPGGEVFERSTFHERFLNRSGTNIRYQVLFDYAISSVLPYNGNASSIFDVVNSFLKNILKNSSEKNKAKPSMLWTEVVYTKEAEILDAINDANQRERKRLASELGSLSEFNNPKSKINQLTPFRKHGFNKPASGGDGEDGGGGPKGRNGGD